MRCVKIEYVAIYIRNKPIFKILCFLYTVCGDSLILIFMPAVCSGVHLTSHVWLCWYLVSMVMSGYSPQNTICGYTFTLLATTIVFYSRSSVDANKNFPFVHNLICVLFVVPWWHSLCSEALCSTPTLGVDHRVVCN